MDNTSKPEEEHSAQSPNSDTTNYSVYGVGLLVVICITIIYCFVKWIRKCKRRWDADALEAAKRDQPGRLYNADHLLYGPHRLEHDPHGIEYSDGEWEETELNQPGPGEAGLLYNADHLLYSRRYSDAESGESDYIQSFANVEGGRRHGNGSAVENLGQLSVGQYKGKSGVGDVRKGKEKAPRGQRPLSPSPPIITGYSDLSSESANSIDPYRKYIPGSLVHKTAKRSDPGSGPSRRRSEYLPLAVMREQVNIQKVRQRMPAQMDEDRV